MKSLKIALCPLMLLLAALHVSQCQDPAKLPTLDNFDVLQDNSELELLGPRSQNFELFEMARGLKHPSDVQSRGKDDSYGSYNSYGGGNEYGSYNYYGENSNYGGYEQHHYEMDEMQELEKCSGEFEKLALDISYAAVYLLRNYTQFVSNTNNKFIVVFK